MEFKIDDKQIKAFTKALKDMSKYGVKKAQQDALNTTAFEARKKAIGNIDRKMIERNTWTRRSVRVQKASFASMVSLLGSTENYMKEQEFGGVKRGRGKVGVGITTSYAAGQEMAKPRTKVARASNKLSRIKITNRKSQGGNKKQQAIATIKQAAQKKDKFVYLDFGRTKGIFKLTGGKKKTKINMVHDLSQKSVKIPKNPWLRPAALDVQRDRRRIYKNALLKEITRVMRRRRVGK